MAKKTGRGRLKAMDGQFEIELTINGREVKWRVGASESLMSALRRQGFKSVKNGCDNGDCGSCTVLLDGKPAASCMLFAAQAHGRTLTTVEGLGTPNDPHTIQRAYAESGGVQCGFCTPGMVLVTKALLAENPRPDEAQVRRALDGNLCRCTGYVKQVQAVLDAAERLRREKK